MIKALNLYAGIGGNRKHWQNVEVTAVEQNPKIAAVYAANFSRDTLIIGDAHEYLLNHFREFDFIWLSRPCQSHSSMRQNLAVRFRGTSPVYPDFGLYEEIVFLQYNADNSRQRWVCENVNPYYEPLIKPTAKIGRHLFWSNFDIPETAAVKDNLRSAQIPDLQIHTGFDLSEFRLPNKRQILRNCVQPVIGELVFSAADLTEKMK
jgi:DNA (cytosine-5)-methyltransferase 1